MADNQHVNKVVYGSTVLIDLTADTVTADKILASYTAHDAAGEQIVGTLDVKGTFYVTLTKRLRKCMRPMRQGTPCMRL